MAPLIKEECDNLRLCVTATDTAAVTYDTCLQLMLATKQL